MALYNDIFCQFCEGFITKEDWKNHLYSGRHLQREAHGYWPAYFAPGKPTKVEGSILEKSFWEMIFATKDCVEVYEFLKTYFKMCTNIKNYVPVRPWFDDEDEQEQWGCGH